MGHTKIEATFIVSLSGLAELIGRLGTGFLADCKILPTYLLVAILAIIGAIAAAITPFLTALVSIGVINFIFTLSVGPILALNPVLLGDSFGVKRLPSGMGILRIFLGVGMLCGTPMGVLYTFQKTLQDQFPTVREMKVFLTILVLEHHC